MMKYYNFWNNIQIEKTKAFWLEDQSDLKLIHYLKDETNLSRCFCDALSFVKKLGGVHGHVLDIGAGVAWTSAIISKFEAVESVTAIDYSRHRLEQISPHVFMQFKGNKKKFKFIIGDFLETEFPKNYYRTIVCCQSLYMFPSLDRVLNKISDLLIQDGILIVSCERITPQYKFLSKKYLKKKVIRFVKGRADSSGNYYYDDHEYQKAIEKAGLNYYYQQLTYPIYYKTNSLPAGNYFGVKN